MELIFSKIHALDYLYFHHIPIQHNLLSMFNSFIFRN